MDIHRVRFVPYPTSAINALAFSHSNFAEVTADDLINLRLAVGRANGDIEIWNPSGKLWVQETIFHGGRNRSIEGLVWIQNPAEEDDDGRKTPGALRLFSIGYSNTITEWNLETGVPLRHWSGNHSEVWCMAAQPRLISSNGSKSKPDAKATAAMGQNIIAGCADGSLVLLSTADNDFTFQKFLSRPTSKRARVLSLTFQNRSTVIAGYADGTIKVFDIRKGMLMRNISLGAAPAGGPKDILVWSVKCLPNGDIVSGDSTGEIRFFERKHYSEVQRIASHDADILDLAICKETNTVFSAGMDRRTASYMSRAADARWMKLGHESYHQHDVKVMSTYEGNNMNVVASGGLDTSLVILPMRRHRSEHQYTICGLPLDPPVDYCSIKSLVVCWWERELSIWRVSKSSNDQNHRLVARIALKGEESICHASLSRSGSLLAIITSAELKIFHLSTNEVPGKDNLTVSKLISTNDLSGRIVQFSPDEQWLAVLSNSNRVCMLSVPRVTDSRSISSLSKLRRMNRSPPPASVSLRAYSSTINRITFSPDSKTLVASDLLGYIDSWVLRDQQASQAVNRASEHTEDSDASDSSESSDDEPNREPQALIWKLTRSSIRLPRLDSPALILSFRDKGCSKDSPQIDGDHELVVLTSQHSIWEFDLLSGTLTDWSRRNPTQSLPEDFKILKARAKGSFWGINGWWWTYGTNWLFGLDMTVDHTGESSKKFASMAEDNKKRKRGGDGAGSSIKKSDLSGLIKPEEVYENIPANGIHSTDLMDIDLEDESGNPMIEGLRGGEIIKRDDNEKKTWFLTLKYKPIVGIVPIKQEDILEVVLVERPVWDLDLPPRFQKLHEH